MALTSSLNTALTGLSSNSKMLNITGNNIANVNTTGFKRSRSSFETSLTTSLHSASAPTQEFGGRNPAQIGHGASVGSVMRDFGGGSLDPTGVNTDMAIDGDGFFVVDDGGNQRYTRAGHFDLDSEFNLVTQEGAKVQGFGVDENNEVVEGVLEPINIPLGNQTVAEATETVRLGGNLNAGGDVATQGSVNVSNTLYSDAAATVQAVAGDDLADLFNGAGDNLFTEGNAGTEGDVITVQNIAKGGTEMPTKTFEVNANNLTGSDDNGTTLQDFMDFMRDTVGIDTGVGGGLAVNAGQIELTGNEGTVNDIAIDSGDIVTNKNTATPDLPFSWTKSQDADGESVRTTFAAFDSLGNEMNMRVSMVLEDKNNAGTTWRYFVQSEDDSDLSRVVDNGTIEFDNNGKLLTDDNPTFTIDRDGTGAENPQTIELQLAGENNTLSALADESSELVTLNQDGSPIGTLEDFSVSQDGTIQGVFSNSLTRTLGQVAMADFANPEGLRDVGSNLFDTTTNSGEAQITAPTDGGVGRVVGSTLEQSNVDLASEFTDMISATTGFSANSRVMQTSDRMIQQLLNAIR